MDKDLKDVAISIDGSIAEITLNRPDTFNAITIAFHQELTTAFRRACDCVCIHWQGFFGGWRF
jgi:enoyl-CoA hydratase/carnithine racemase